MIRPENPDVHSNRLLLRVSVVAALGVAGVLAYAAHEFNHKMEQTFEPVMLPEEHHEGMKPLKDPELGPESGKPTAIAIPLEFIARTARF